MKNIPYSRFYDVAAKTLREFYETDLTNEEILKILKTNEIFNCNVSESFINFKNGMVKIFYKNNPVEKYGDGVIEFY